MSLRSVLTALCDGLAAMLRVAETFSCEPISIRVTKVAKVAPLTITHQDVNYMISLESLSTTVFEARTATGGELFSLLTCPHNNSFALPSIFSPLGINDNTDINKTIRSWHEKWSLPVAVRVSKMRVLKLLLILHSLKPRIISIRRNAKLFLSYTIHWVHFLFFFSSRQTPGTEKCKSRSKFSLMEAPWSTASVNSSCWTLSHNFHDNPAIPGWGKEIWNIQYF